MITICRFLNDAPCAYSMTYDEGFIDVLTNAYPIHKKYGISGHLDVVAGQLGQRRNCFDSSLNGFFHMGVDHLKFLISEGWSVGNHSWSHFSYPQQPGLDLYREIVYSKYYLEDKLGIPVTHFAIPNENYNYEPSLPYIKQTGYLSCQIVDGAVNYDGVDLLKIGNFMVASGKIKPRPGWPEKLLTKNIALEDIQCGWLCETTHLVQPYPIQDWKNVSCEDLEKRFIKIIEITNKKGWLAIPEDVIDYILLRRSVKIIKLNDGEYELIVNLPVGIRNRQLSFKTEDKGKAIEKILFEEKEVKFIWEEGNVIFTIENIIPDFLNNKQHIKIFRKEIVHP